jgi:undecaprenyl-diphosphatase
MSHLLNAALKGILEGFTEFLPISSTGHLILTNQYLPLTSDPAQAEALNRIFNLVIQFPAILAIVILYRQRLWDAARTVRTEPRARRFWLGLFLGFLPIAVAGLAVKNQVESLDRHPMVVAVALIAGGVVLLLVERLATHSTITRGEDVPVSTAVSIGVCQCLALIPGVSRSGASIVSGRMMGLNRAAAAEFSFFLALPTMGAACGYKLLKDYGSIDWCAHGPVLLVGCVTSFVTAWIVVALFIRLLEKRYGLAMWGWYRLALGAVVLALAR